MENQNEQNNEQTAQIPTEAEREAAIKNIDEKLKQSEGDQSSFETGKSAALAETGSDTDRTGNDSVESVETVKNLEYDRNANSVIPLVIPRGANVFRTQIEFAPVSDDEFLALMEETKATGERLKTLSTEFYEPLIALGKRKAVNAFGYAEKPGGWRSAVSDADYSQGIAKLLDCTAKHELEETAELLDYDAPVKMAVFFLDNQGYDAKKYIYYKQAAKAHLDEFLAAKLNEPQKNVLASAARKTFNQRMLELAKQLLADSDYKSAIPCWHLIFSVVTYLEAEISRLGKF